MSEPSPPTVRRALTVVRLRRLLHLLALTAVAFPLVAPAPAGAGVTPADPETVPAEAGAVRHGEDEHEVTARELIGAHTIDDVLRGRGLERGPLDRVEVVHARDDRLLLRLVHVELDREFIDEELAIRVTTIEDPEMLRGFSEVVREGRPERVIRTELVLRADGAVESRLTVGSSVVVPGIDRIERVGVREVEGGTVWDALARCESSGRWDVVRVVNDDLSYHGGLQFAPPTWDAFRPAGFPTVASQATREQQILVAERVRAVQGWGAWPSCSARLGLR